MPVTVIGFVAWIVPGGLPFATPIESYGMRLITSICCIANSVPRVRSRDAPYVHIDEASNPPSAVATIKKIVRPNTTSARAKPPSPRDD